jgi:hypothetical protein
MTFIKTSELSKGWSRLTVRSQLPSHMPEEYDKEISPLSGLLFSLTTEQFFKCSQYPSRLWTSSTILNQQISCHQRICGHHSLHHQRSRIPTSVTKLHGLCCTVRSNITWQSTELFVGRWRSRTDTR